MSIMNFTSLATLLFHYNDVIMGAIASQITSPLIVYSIVYSDANQRKYQSSASLAFVQEIHQGPVNSPHKWPVTWKMFPFDYVIMFQQFVQVNVKISKPDITGLFWGNHQWLVDSPHKGPAIQTAFPFHDIIMNSQDHGLQTGYQYSWKYHFVNHSSWYLPEHD